MALNTTKLNLVTISVKAKLRYSCYTEYCYAECHYSECRYIECRYIECHYIECRYNECSYIECHYTECRYAECHGTYLETPHRQLGKTGSLNYECQ